MSDGVTDALRAAIINGVYLPGDRLPLRDLTERFRVSATPVRTALVNLANEGLVTNEAHRGSSVTALSESEITDIFDLRARLEALAARSAVPNLSGDDISALRDLAVRMEQSDEVSQTIALNNMLHMRLYKASERPYLLHLLHTSRLRVQQYMRWYVEETDRLREAEHEHHLIIDACEAGDSDRVAELIEGHVRAAIPHVVKGAKHLAAQARNRGSN